MNTVLDEIGGCWKIKRDGLERLLALSKALAEMLSNSDSEDDLEDETESIVDEREDIVGRMKENDLALKYHISQLPAAEKALYDKVLSTPKNDGASFESDTAARIYIDLCTCEKILPELKMSDEANGEKIKSIMDDIAKKIKNIKDNKKMMDKFNINENVQSGVLFTDKK